MLKKTLIWLGTVGLGLGLLLLCVFAYVNSSPGKRLLSEKVSTLFDIPVSIRGSVLPAKSLSSFHIERVVVQDSDKSERMLEIEGLVIEMPWFGWLGSESTNWRARIERLYIHLTEKNDGSIDESVGFEMPDFNAILSIDQVLIRKNDTNVAQLRQFDLKVIEDRSVEIFSSGELLDMPFKIESALKATSKKTATLESSINYRGFSIGLSGSIDDLKLLKTNGLLLYAQSDTELAGMSVKSQGKLAGDLSDWKFIVDELTFTSAHSQFSTSMSIDGGTEKNLRLTDGRGALKTTDAVRLFKLFELESPVEGVIDASVAFSGVKDQLKLEDLNVSMGDSHIVFSSIGMVSFKSTLSAHLDGHLKFKNPASVVTQLDDQWGEAFRGDVSAEITIGKQRISLNDLKGNFSKDELLFSIEGNMQDVRTQSGSQLSISSITKLEDQPENTNQKFIPPWTLSIDAIDGFAQPVSMTGSLQLRSGDLKLSGQVENLVEQKGLDLEFVYSPAAPEDKGPFNFDFASALVPEKMVGTIKADSLKSGEFELSATQVEGKSKIQFKGNIESGSALEGRGEIDIEKADPNPFLQQAGLNMTLPALADFKANLKYDEKGFVLENLLFRTGETEIGGKVEYLKPDLSVPVLNLTLESPNINIVDLGYVTSHETSYFSDSPLNLQIFKQLDLDMSLTAQRLLTPALVYKNLNLSAQSHQGQFSLQADQDLLGGGNSAVIAAVDTDGDLPSVELTTKVNNINPAEIRALADDDGGYSGDVDLELDITGTGNSIKEILSRSNGYFLLRVNKASLADRKLHLLSADFILSVMRLLNPFSKVDARLQVECGLAAFHIKDGLARAKNSIVLSGEKIFLQGSGEIDLSSEKVKLDLKPKANQGIGIGASTLINEIKVVGSLAEPKIKTSSKSLLKSGASIGAAMASGGMSLFFQGMFNRITSGGQECEKAEKQFWVVDERTVLAQPESLTD